jgi:hypothetical protein
MYIVHAICFKMEIFKFDASIYNRQTYSYIHPHCCVHRVYEEEENRRQQMLPLLQYYFVFSLILYAILGCECFSLQYNPL